MLKQIGNGQSKYDILTLIISSQGVSSATPRICRASCSVIVLLALWIVFCIVSCATPFFEASGTT
jgi:hypothetical protein